MTTSYDVMADAVCEIADAARQAFIKAGFDPGEWDSDNIVQDVKRGLVGAIEKLSLRSATASRTGQGRTMPPGQLSCDWVEDFSHENGQYQCRCCFCEALFYGHKRRVVCRNCNTPMRSPAGATPDVGILLRQQGPQVMSPDTGHSDKNGETFADGEYRFKLGDQWYYKGNRSPSWFYVASRADGSCQGGICERVEHGSICKLLNDIAERLAGKDAAQSATARGKGDRRFGVDERRSWKDRRVTDEPGAPIRRMFKRRVADYAKGDGIYDRRKAARPEDTGRTS